MSWIIVKRYAKLCFVNQNKFVVARKPGLWGFTAPPLEGVMRIANQGETKNQPA